MRVKKEKFVVKAITFAAPIEDMILTFLSGTAPKIKGKTQYL